MNFKSKIKKIIQVKGNKLILGGQSIAFDQSFSYVLNELDEILQSKYQPLTDKEIYERLTTALDIQIEKAPDPFIFHIYHTKDSLETIIEWYNKLGKIEKYWDWMKSGDAGSDSFWIAHSHITDILGDKE